MKFRQTSLSGIAILKKKKSILLISFFSIILKLGGKSPGKSLNVQDGHWSGKSQEILEIGQEKFQNFGPK